MLHKKHLYHRNVTSPITCSQLLVKYSQSEISVICNVNTSYHRPTSSTEEHWGTIELRRNSIKFFGRSFWQIHFAQGRLNWRTLRCSYGIVQLRNNWEFGTRTQVLVVKTSYHRPTSSTEEHWGIIGLRKNSIKILWMQFLTNSLC